MRKRTDIRNQLNDSFFVYLPVERGHDRLKACHDLHAGVQDRLPKVCFVRSDLSAVSQSYRVTEHSAQVRATAGAFRLVSSPIGRARQTARMVAEATGLPVTFDDRLKEIACGAWEGRLRSEIAHHHPEAFATREWFFGAPGGETFDDVWARAADWLASLPPEPERRVIAVSHGVWGRLARGAYAGLDRQATLNQDVPQDAVFRLQNGQIDRFDCAPVD